MGVSDRCDAALAAGGGLAVEDAALAGCNAAVVVRAAPADDGRVASEEETPFATPVGVPSGSPLPGWTGFSLMRLFDLNLKQFAVFARAKSEPDWHFEPDWPL